MDHSVDQVRRPALSHLGRVRALPRITALSFGLGLVAATLTAVAALAPGLRGAYYAPGLHVAIETTALLTVFLAASLVGDRYLRSARLDDLLLVVALIVFGTANLAFDLVPDLFLDLPLHRHPVVAWANVVANLAGALALALAAWLPGRRLARPRLVGGMVVAASLVAAVLVGALLNRLLADLPAALLYPKLVYHVSDLSGDTGLLAIQVSTMLSFALAAAGFKLRRARSGDGMRPWLALGSMLGAFASLNYFLYPTLSAGWVYVGDVLRIAFYVLLLAGAIREIVLHWRNLGAAAGIEKRRRIARDLHNGLAQELAYIQFCAPEIGVEGSTAGNQIALSAKRALVEVRRAIAELTQQLDEPLDVLLARTLSDTAGRVAPSVSLSLVAGVDAPTRVKEALLRIATDAVAHAARQPGTTKITVELARDPQLRLCVSDDSHGLAGGETSAGSFGLSGIQQQAAEIGASLYTQCDPGRGTAIEVVLP